jgi:predicted amidohydrolase YtcJ
MSHGVRVVLGSDAPVASIDPRQGICAAITRQREENRSEGSFFAEECLSEEQALLAYTRWAAQAAAWDEEVGSLRAGKLADLVALEAPASDDPYGWKRARIRMTMVDGKIVYDDLP